MSDGVLPVQTLRRAVALYLGLAYPDGAVPGVVQARLAVLDALAPGGLVPEGFFEPASGGTSQPGCRNLALRLGQPTYPHMKLVVESCPRGGILLRADAHDAHLHAPPDSPDAAPLAALRARNKELTEQIEAAWAAAGLPTFRAFLRSELERRRRHV